MFWEILTLLAIALLIALSAFFAAAEMAFVSVNRIRVVDEASKGNKRAKLLEKLLEKPDEVVSAIVVGNNIVNITASIIAGVAAAYVMGNVGVGIATAVMTILIIIFGESTPKAIGLENDALAIKLAPHLRIIRMVFYPISRVFTYISQSIIRIFHIKKSRRNKVTEEEIKTMLDIGVREGTINSDEKELVEEIFDFDETRAVEVYVPRDEMVYLYETDTVEDLINKSLETGYSRFPVCRESIDDVVGMVHVKDALAVDKKTPLGEIMRDILKISPGMKVDDVLREMQKRKVHMAVIQAKDGKIIGLVTLEDLIEEIFGEIRDEHDMK
ncbi:MAG: HlyC/CorC family transporter [Thermoplasmata archaeon]|nr:HlyC/CorC family transporter [Thermoplasmata archaeon]